MGLTARLSVFGLLALVGCGFDASLSRPDGGTTPIDGDSGGASDADKDAPEVVMLVDRGLVARYFISEPAGTTPATLPDSAPSPQALPITYGQATFVEEGGHRGLHWGQSQSTGKLELELGGTKLGAQLATSRTVTIEVVVQITASGPSGSDSTITGMRGSNPDFVFCSYGTSNLRFYKPYGDDSATWTNVNQQDRMVLHLVFDTTRAAGEERVQLYKNGSPIDKTTSSPPAQYSSVGLGGTDDFMIGNRQGQDRSIAGTIYYVAYYDEPLVPTEIENNAKRLLASDDP